MRSYIGYDYVLIWNILVLILASGITRFGVSETSAEPDLSLQPDENGNVLMRSTHAVASSVNIWSLEEREQLIEGLFIYDKVKVDWDPMDGPKVLENLIILHLEKCSINPNSITFGETLRTITIRQPEFLNGTLGDLLRTAPNIVDLHISDTKIYLADITNSGGSIKHLFIQDSEISISETENPILPIRKWSRLSIFSTRLINGELSQVLQAVQESIQRIEIKNMGVIHISNLEFTELQKFEVRRCVFDAESQSINFPTLQEFTLRNASLNPNAVVFSDSLYSMKLKDVKLIGGGLHHLTKTASNLVRLEVSGYVQCKDSIQLEAPIPMKHLKKLEIYSSELSPHIFKFPELLELVITDTVFVNGTLHDFLKSATSLEDLYIEAIRETAKEEGEVFLAQLPLETLVRLSISQVKCFCDNIEAIVFEKLTSLYLEELDVTPSCLKSVFVNFATLFPEMNDIEIGIGIVLSPTAALSIINAPRTTFMTFLFEFDPQVKTYKFGKVMEILREAGINEYVRGYYQKQNLGAELLPSVRHLSMRRNFQDANPKWELSNEFTAQLDDVKDFQSLAKDTALVFVYFAIFYIVILTGVIGNVISAFILVKMKRWNSSCLILLSLTFFDSIVIVSYFVSSFFTIGLFKSLFLEVGRKQVYLESEERLWMAEQNPLDAFVVYPIKKSAYTGSVYSTVLIALERFIAVCMPLRARELLKTTNTKIAILSVLAISIIFNLPRWIESYEWDFYTSDSHYWNDFYKPKLMRIEMYYIIYHQCLWPVLMYVLPFVLLGVFNFKIAKQILSSSRFRRTSATSSTAQTDPEVLSVTKMLLCVVVVFVMLNSIHISIIVYFFLAYEGVEISTIEALAGIPIIVNSSVNFFIYMMLGKTFRTEFLKLIPNVLKSWFGHTCTRAPDEGVATATMDSSKSATHQTGDVELSSVIT